MNQDDGDLDSQLELHLDLLVPWDLPIDEQLNEIETIKFTQILNQLLNALTQLEPQAGLIIAKNALNQIGELEIFPADISSTKTALKGWEVKDFDHHFDVHHVHSQQPASCLIRSLLLAVYRMFILLCERDYSFNPMEVERQKKGYISYIRLLSRVYHLNLQESQ